MNLRIRVRFAPRLDLGPTLVTANAGPSCYGSIIQIMEVASLASFRLRSARCVRDGGRFAFRQTHFFRLSRSRSAI